MRQNQPPRALSVQLASKIQIENVTKETSLFNCRITWDPCIENKFQNFMSVCFCDNSFIIFTFILNCSKMPIISGVFLFQITYKTSRPVYFIILFLNFFSKISGGLVRLFFNQVELQCNIILKNILNICAWIKYLNNINLQHEY